MDVHFSFFFSPAGEVFMPHFRKNCELNEALSKSCLVDSETVLSGCITLEVVISRKWSRDPVCRWSICHMRFPIRANNTNRKLGIFDRKLERSPSLFQRYFDKHFRK